jgi:dTDP-glucose 4,6-dehydratase
MRIVLTGGGGFLGSHICEHLLARGEHVVCVDDWSTSSPTNISHLRGHAGLTVVRADVSDPMHVPGTVDIVAHFASPASPPDYHRLPLETLAVGSRGTENMLGLALHKDARFVLASTSEVYGDPLVHPQTEKYWGNVNPIGPRSVYDEAKRFAEALTAAYARTFGLPVGIVRIFNTYGPRMRAHDGRVVSTFIRQALDGEPLTCFGDGSQTRSFCYVDDLVRGIVAMLDSTETGPINLGNPAEITVAELAALVIEIIGSASAAELRPLPDDDPARRRPDITLATELLGWRPNIELREGLQRTVNWFTARSRADQTQLSRQAM